jgi:hypothetical protein
MPVTAVAMTVMVMVVMMPVSATKTKAKARPVGVVATVRIGVVVIWPVQPNHAAMAVTAMPPAAAHPHDVLHNRILLGDRFQVL